MKCLVTGADGLVGNRLVKTLLSRGDFVIALDISFALTGLTDGDNLKVLQADITDISAIRNSFEGVDVVFHQAARRSIPVSFTEPFATFETNVYGTSVVLECARQAGCKRFVFGSSSSVYGNADVLPVTEDTPLKPQSPYSSSKAAAEKIVQCYHISFGLETVSLRYFNIYGPRRDFTAPNVEVIPRFIALMASGRQPTIYGDGTQSRDFVHVDDVVTANILAATSKTAIGNTYNIASGVSYTVLDIINEINSFLGTNLEPLIMPIRKGDALHTAADISRARRDLGYSPAVTLHTGLERTARELAGRR